MTKNKTRRVLNQMVTAISALSIGLQPLLAQTVPVAGGPLIVTAPNGVPMVMIETPNTQGVSHNRYDQFNVGPEGLLLNNIADNYALTQLGGIVPGNANLAGGAASIILNEVVSPNISTLAGYLEVAGTRADVILANPYGITCNGCGFLNMDRMTLATGTPTWSGGTFTGLGIDGGEITIGERGAAALDTMRFDLLSRRITVAGAVQGQRLRVVAGRNDVVYLTDDVTARAPDGSAAPELAIDSTVLGGMYAGAITITSTEQGVGVRAPQNMAASAGDMRITADGRLVMGRASAQGTLRAQSRSSSVEVHESLAARQALEVAAAEQITLEANARLVSEAVATLEADAGIHVGTGAELATAQGLRLDGGSGDVVLAAAARVLSHGSISIDADSIEAGNEAQILAGMARDGVMDPDSLLSLQAQNTLRLSAAQALSGGDISVDARIIAIGAQGGLPAGNFMAQGDIDIRTGRIDAQDAQIIADGALSIASDGTGLDLAGGTLQAGQSLTIDATGALDISAALQSIAGDVSLSAGQDIALAGQVLTGGALSIQAPGDVHVEAILQARDAITASAAALSTTSIWQTEDGRIEVTANHLTNSGTLASAADLRLVLADALVNTGTLYAAGLLSVSGDLNTTQNTSPGRLIGAEGVDLVTGTLTNAGIIAALSSDLTLSAATLDNSGLVQASLGHLRLSGSNLNNSGSVIAAAGNLSIEIAATIQNAGLLHAAGLVAISGEVPGNDPALANAADGEIIAGQGMALWVSTLSNAGTLASAQGHLVVESAGDIMNSGLAFAGQDLTLLSDGMILNDAGVLLAEGTIRLAGLESPHALSMVNRQGGLIESFGGDIRIFAGSIQNLGPEVTLGQTATTDVHSAVTAGHCPSLGLFSYSCTTTTTTTTVTTDTATQSGNVSMIIAARDIVLAGGDALNAYSLISAGRDIHINLETLTNTGVSLMELTEVTSQDVTRSQFCILFCFSTITTGELVVHDPVVEQIGAVFATIEAGGSIIGTVAGYLANGAVGAGANVGGASGTTPGVTGPDAITIPTVAVDPSGLTPLAASFGPQTGGALGNAALFVTSVDPDAPFLLETRYEFIDLSRFLSSDYFLSSLNYDPSRLQKRFGDAWAETLFVREQMFRLTGQSLGNNEIDAYEQMRRLYDAAIDAARNLDLSPGVALTPAQIAALTEDMIWLEEAVVNGQTVLVPRLYLASASSLAAARATPAGSSLSAGLDIGLLAGEFVNSGAVSAGRDLRLVVEGDFANLGGQLGAQNILSIDVAGTLTSLSGAIAAEFVSLSAQDIVIATAVQRGGDAQSYQDAAALTSTVQAGSELQMLAERGIRLLGADITSGGNATLLAGDGISVEALALDGRAELAFAGGSYLAESRQHQVTRITSGGDLVLFAQQGDIVLEAANIRADGNVGLIAAQGDVVLAAVADHSFSDLSAQGGNFLARYTLRDQRFDLTHQVSQIAGEGIDILAAGTILAEGTRFETTGLQGDMQAALAGGDLRLTSLAGSVVVTAPTDVSARSYQASSAYLGGLFGSSDDYRSLDTEALRSTARVAGAIELAAAQDLVLTAVDFAAEGTFSTQVGGETWLLAAVDTSYASEHRMRNNGITITTVTREDYSERATFNELRAAGFNFDEGAPVTFDALRDPLLTSTHAAALVNPGDTMMTLAAMFLGTTDPATGPPADSTAGADASDWRAGLDMRQIALPGLADGPGFGYIDPLLDRETTVNNAIFLIDQHYYDRQVELNPAFRALLSVAVSFVLGPAMFDISGVLGLAQGSWQAAAATAFSNSLTVGVLEGAITGNLDLGRILENAAFSGVTAGLTAGISLQGMGVEWGDGATRSLFGNGNLSIANLAERGLDATITAALRTGVYGDDFLQGFAASFGASAAGLLMADLHNVIGSGIGAGHYSEGDLVHVSLHALVGCAMAELQGADCAAGAVGGAVSALYGGYLERNGGVAEDAQAATIARAELIGALAGYFVSSGRGDNVSTAGGVAASALQNNYLTVQDIANLTAELEACQRKEGGCSEEETRDLIDKYRELSARRDYELVQECGSDLSCINQRLSEVASTGALAQVAALDPGVAYALVSAIEPSPMTWQQINANIERYHFYEHQCGSNAACLADPIGFHEMQILEVALSEVARDFALSFYMDADGNVVVVNTAIDGISAALGLVELAIPDAARAMAAKQFALSATGEVIELFRSDDPARQAAVSAGVLAGGLAAGKLASSMCGGGMTLSGWACGVFAGSIASEYGGKLAGMTYDLLRVVNSDD